MMLTSLTPSLLNVPFPRRAEDRRCAHSLHRGRQCVHGAAGSGPQVSSANQGSEVGRSERRMRRWRCSSGAALGWRRYFTPTKIRSGVTLRPPPPSSRLSTIFAQVGCRGGGPINAVQPERGVPLYGVSGEAGRLDGGQRPGGVRGVRMLQRLQHQFAPRPLAGRRSQGTVPVQDAGQHAEIVDPEPASAGETVAAGDHVWPVWPVARGRGPCRGSRPMAKPSGPTKTPWCRARSRPACWSSGQARLVLNSPTFSMLWV